MNSKNIDTLAKIVWDYLKIDNPLEKADLVLALGSHDLRVAQRAAEVYLQGFAPLILFAGGFGRLTGDWTVPEAEMFAQKAIEMGVPKEDILIENKSTNTGENIRFSYELIKQNGINPKKILIVHKPYMQRRACGTFMKQWPGEKKDILVTSPQISFEDYPNQEITKEEVINIMVGDLQRIKLYPQKGFQIYQEIPDNVWQAYEELVKLGYNKQLVKE